jgi:PAS domain S-box-containing protein
MIASLLRERGYETGVCRDIPDACRTMEQLAGALILTDGAFQHPERECLFEILKKQPSWSELPLIIVARRGDENLAELLDLTASAAGGISLLERPLTPSMLVRSVEVALRSRRRQYQVRDLLDEERRQQRQLGDANRHAARELVERNRTQEMLARRVREQTAVYEFMDRLHHTSSLDEIYSAALDSIVDALGCQRASILLLDECNVMKFVAWRGLSRDYRQAVEGHSPWESTDSSPSVIPVEDVDETEFPEPLREVVRSEGIRALAFIPLTVNGNLLGKFMTYYDSPHQFSAEEISLALTLAGQIGFAVDRKRAEETRGRLAAIVESSEDSIISIDLDGVITSWNRSAERLFGYTMAEAVGRPVAIIFPGDRLEEEPRILSRIRNRQTMDHYETVRLHKDGTLLDISLSVSPILDAHGTIVGAAKIARDMSDRKRAEQELQASEERYRTLVAQVKDYAIFRIDSLGQPTSWNEGVQRVLGFGEADFIGRDIMSIFTPEDIRNGVPQQELRQAAETGTAGNDRWMRRADGSRFFASGVTTALRSPAGKHIGYTKVLRDITVLAEARGRLEAHAIDLERTVATRTRELKATNEQLEAFVYSIAHDLRAPLRAVTGYSQLLLQDHAPQLESDVQEILGRIHTSAEFMDRLLLDLLAFGTTARSQMDLSPVEVQGAWKAAVFQSAAEIERTGARIEVIPPLPVVIAHGPTLGQCLANLLGNSLKFVADGVRPHVRFWAERRRNTVRLWLQDNGIGIPQDQTERVFRVFERLHGARYPGTGIGLAIVRKGLERMGGSVGLESEPGHGTRFWIDLPAARPSELKPGPNGGTFRTPRQREAQPSA